MPKRKSIKKIIDIDSVWVEEPEKIREFLNCRPEYEQLGTEIVYILEKKLREAKIEISSVTTRAKTLNSFLEKITRKSYTEPFKEITDFAGVRIVFLYESSFKDIEAIIGREFEVVEKVDKLNDKGLDRFGYGAIHYIVKLGSESSGARYDYLKKLKCEIQVRTVLQDAWAIIDHHLVYKNESDIPTTLQRKLNSLAGLFETADNQFEILRQEREHYLASLKSTVNTQGFLENEVNLDTFEEFAKWKFPDKAVESYKGQTQRIFRSVSKIGFSTISEINSIIEKYKMDIPQISEEFKKIDKEIPEWSGVFSSGILLAIENDDLRKMAQIKEEQKAILQKFKK
jgi:ppGpp synthetase/RelA/SpoT-type nucleotidyltranferase